MSDTLAGRGQDEGAARAENSSSEVQHEDPVNKAMRLGCTWVIIVAVIAVVLFAFLPVSEAPPKKAADQSATISDAPAPLRPIEQAQVAADKRRKLADLLEAEKSLPRENVESILSFWNDIVALAPDNAEYRRRRDEAQIASDEMARFREEPERGGEITKFNPWPGAFGSVLLADMTIRNRSLSHLKDFLVTCRLKGSSGTTISETQTIIYEMVEARSSKKLKEVNLGLMHSQTKSVDCQIETAKIA